MNESDMIELYDLAKKLKRAEKTIERVREVVNQYVEHGDFVEKETALDILKALEGESE